MDTVFIEVLRYLDSAMVPQWAWDERRRLQSCCFKNTEWDFGNGFLKKIVKLRRGSGKDRQGMAVKAKGLKA